MTRTALTLAAAAAFAVPALASADRGTSSTSAFAVASPAGTTFSSPSRFADDILFDDLESLTPGPLNPGRTSADGVLYTSFDGDVTAGPDQDILQTNTFADDFGFSEIDADYSTTIAPQADNGFIVAFDYELSDFATTRLFRPTSQELTFFSVAGDVDNDGDLDVLEGNGAGGAAFFDTGVSLPLAANLAFQVEDTALTILIDEVPVYTGIILGGNDAGITTPETSTGVDFFSGNNAAGFGSTLAIDNLSVSTVPEPTSLAVLGLAGMGMLRRRRA